MISRTRDWSSLPRRHLRYSAGADFINFLQCDQVTISNCCCGEYIFAATLLLFYSQSRWTLHCKYLMALRCGDMWYLWSMPSLSLKANTILPRRDGSWQNRKRRSRVKSKRSKMAFIFTFLSFTSYHSFLKNNLQCIACNACYAEWSIKST